MSWAEMGGIHPGQLSGGTEQWEPRHLQLSAWPSCRKPMLWVPSFEDPSFFDINIKGFSIHLQGKGTLLPLSSSKLILIAMDPPCSWNPHPALTRPLLGIDLAKSFRLVSPGSLNICTH